MEPNHTLDALGQWLRRVLREGLYPDENVEAYMLSTFGTTDLAAIQAAADSSEIDSLEELLLYPDSGLQVRYEREWGRVVFDTDAPARVIACLESPPVQSALYFPQQRQPVLWPVSSFALAGFVQRLNIAWQPPAGFDRCLEQSLPEDQRAVVRVRLRNARVRWTAQRTGLMCQYLEKMAASDPDFDPGLEYLLSRLWALEPERPPYDFLIDQKQTLFQSLCRAEDFERRRRTVNMEILMLQGERAAYGDLEQIKAQMRLIDTLCNALFGRTRFFSQPAEHSVAVGGRDCGDIVDTVLKTLI